MRVAAYPSSKPKKSHMNDLDARKDCYAQPGGQIFKLLDTRHDFDGERGQRNIR